ncbi:hypothetical protein EV667_2626 [Ancylobacter aquaticus]|uniref:Uncharacterized protein n=2 Tax=Ancylobacter aquaticus TaxID=100 RepID=A0A4R1I0E6_ANCAQ|nr:hypothetical protein EV667_2626 [Ancylobacter aquaticus]
MSRLRTEATLCHGFGHDKELKSNFDVIKANPTLANPEGKIMPILLWLIGIPIPIILLIWLLT